MEMMLAFLKDDSVKTPARIIGQMANLRNETPAATIRFIQSQIGGPLAAQVAESSQALDRVDF